MVAEGRVAIHERAWPADECGFHPALLQAILAREARDPGLRVSNVGGWHSTPDLLAWDDPGVAPLVARILEAAASHCPGVNRMQAWANVMRQGAAHLAHRHGDVPWSGVYYVDAGDRNCGGRITFAHGEAHRTMAPADGLLLIFPGDLLHSVETYTGARPRVSVAFNLATSG